MALAVVYTLNVKYKWIYATFVILLILIINIREIIFIFKKFIETLKRRKKNAQRDTEGTQVVVEEKGVDSSAEDNAQESKENIDNEQN